MTNVQDVTTTTSSAHSAPVIAPTSGLRRQPSQARSVARVQRMLDTFERLVGEHGFDAVSTTLVAEHAEVSVGSLYQFFPDKKALAQALATRYLESFTIKVGELFAARHFDTWLDAVDPMVDLYVGMQRAIPAFRHIRFGDPIDGQLLNDANDNNDVITAKVEAVIEGIVGGFEDPATAGHMDPVLALGLALEAGDAVLKFAFRLNPLGDPALVEVAKAVVRTVLGSLDLPPVPTTRTINLTEPVAATVGAPAGGE